MSGTWIRIAVEGRAEKHPPAARARRPNRQNRRSKQCRPTPRHAARHGPLTVASKNLTTFAVRRFTRASAARLTGRRHMPPSASGPPLAGAAAVLQRQRDPYRSRGGAPARQCLVSREHKLRLHNMVSLVQPRRRCQPKWHAAPPSPINRGTLPSPPRTHVH